MSILLICLRIFQLSKKVKMASHTSYPIVGHAALKKPTVEPSSPSTLLLSIPKIVWLISSYENEDIRCFLCLSRSKGP